MNNLFRTSLLLSLLGIVTTPAIAMERSSADYDYTYKSSALNLAGVMSRNFTSEYPNPSIDKQLKNKNKDGFIYPKSIESLSPETKTSQDNSFLVETSGEPRTVPFRISIFQL